MKIATIVGARPQFIKMAPLSRELKRSHEEVIIHTGQHYDHEMDGIFFEELNIAEPDYNLGVGSGSHGYQTGEMLKKIEEILIDEEPKLVIVYGDTNSTIAGALAASKLHIKIAHVEAGLRSFNRDMPEEINRIVTDHVCNLLFAPSETAVEHLKNEGVLDDVHLVGDLMYDAILWARDIAKEKSDVLEKVGLKENQYILSTVHRPSNTDKKENLESIINAFADAKLSVVLPIHPRTRKRLKEFDLWETAKESIKIIDPVGYLDFVRLIDGAERVATDSGGIQKEAFFLDTPCVTMREETEWVETVECGWNVLVGSDFDKIVYELNKDWDVSPPKPSPYGNGDAALSIYSIINNY